MNFRFPFIRSRYALLRGSLIVLPYLSYVGLVGLIALIFSLLAKHRRSALDSFTRNGLLLLTGLLILSSGLAANRGEAFLQLANFLPFFLLFGVLPFLLDRTERLAQLATDIVIAALPINAFALVEYILRTEWVQRTYRSFPLVRWARLRPHVGRAMVMFDHPNALASYLVLVFGLGLGLILYQAVCRRSQPNLNSNNPNLIRGVPASWKTKLLYVATYANLIGIFCSGSRNGLMIAVAQILIFGLLWGVFLKASRVVLLVSGLGLSGIVAGAVRLGIGGRTLALNEWANDPRLRLWHISFSLLQERPWLGWGLGNYKFEFAGRLLSLYPSCVNVRSRRIVPVECADVTHAHNFWLTLATEGGLIVAIGLTLWVGYLCFRAVQVFMSTQSPAPERMLLLAYLLAFSGCIAFACFDVTLYDARVNTLDWFILAGIYALSHSSASLTSPLNHPQSKI